MVPILDEVELYFHIPFCIQKCQYCDFLSGPATIPEQKFYFEALQQETKGRSKDLIGKTVRSIFIGGGTPSMVDSLWIEQLLQTIREHFCLNEGVEVSIEVNPGTVDEQKLTRYYQAGINRLSIGLQSVREEELRRLGRIHTFEQFLETYQTARLVGFGNINIDIMSALPRQRIQSYLETLDTVVSLKPEHISAYSLIVEEGTPFAKEAREGSLELPDEDCERQMYELTGQVMAEHGYQRYEISNYALPGYECRHNCGYWRRIPYLGFGVGAASLLEETRFRNSSDLDIYCQKPLECREEIHKLTVSEQMEEFLFLGLRLLRGVDKEEFAQKFGVSLISVYEEVLCKNKKDGLLLEDTKRIRLSERGLDLSNYVMAQFLL